MEPQFDWTWPQRPTSAAEFDAMMASLDQHLAAHEIRPYQRGFRAAMLLSSVFRFQVPIVGTTGPRGEPFGPSDLVARAFEWYEANYGERNKVDPSPGSIVIALHGSYWRARMPCLFGTFSIGIDRDLSQWADDGFPAKGGHQINALALVEDFPQAYASRLSDHDLERIFNEIYFGYHAVMALAGLHGDELFDQARGDYEHSIEAIISGRHLSKARWDNAQCAEKVLKGLLNSAGFRSSYSTQGRDGHDIVKLGQAANEKLGFDFSEGSLRAIYCPTSIRYGEMNVSHNEAYTSHRELLSMLLKIAMKTSAQP